MNELLKKSATEQSKALKNKEIRFNKIIDKSEMKDYVFDALEIK